MRRHLPPLPVAALAASLLMPACPAARADSSADRSDLHACVQDVRRSLSGGSDATWWELGGRVAVDAVRRGSHEPRPRTAAHADDALLALRAGRRQLHGLVELDLDGSDTRSHLREAWLGWSFGSRLVVRAGQVRQPMNSEAGTPAQDRPTRGAAFTTHLTDRVAPGLAAESEWNCGAIRYEVTATSGHGSDTAGARRSADRITGRVVLRPLQNALPEGRWRERGNGLWSGLALARDRHAEGDSLRIESPLEARIVDTAGLGANEARTWLAEIGWSDGPLRVSFERTETRWEDVPTAAGPRDIDGVSAWTAHAVVALSGADPAADHGRWTRGRVESRPTWGTWELGARASHVTVDRELLTAAGASPGRSPHHARTLSLELGWRPDEAVRVSLGLVRTQGSDPLDAFAGHRRDISLLLGLEVAF